MSDPDPKLVGEKLAEFIAAADSGLSDEEIAAILERMSTEAVRLAFLMLMPRLRGISNAVRLQAERDGWRKIADSLLRVAFGENTDFGEIPPVELLELRSLGQRDMKYVAALEQFWRDLTRKHAELRDRQRRNWEEREHELRAFEEADGFDDEEGE